MTFEADREGTSLRVVVILPPCLLVWVLRKGQRGQP